MLDKDLVQGEGDRSKLRAQVFRSRIGTESFQPYLGRLVRVVEHSRDRAIGSTDAAVDTDVEGEYHVVPGDWMNALARRLVVAGIRPALSWTGGQEAATVDL